MLLAFFPTPYPDEILYSILARYALRAGYTSPKMVLKDLFGLTTVSAVIDLPSHIDRLISRMPANSKHTAEEFIYRYTLFPFYAPFLPSERVNKVLKGMRGDYGGTIHLMTGIMASTFPEPAFLRFCPVCNEQDYKVFGEYYWHRLHQVPGVVVCPEHKVPLLNSDVPYRRNNKHEFVSALPENCRVQSIGKINSKAVDRLFQLAVDCRWLFNKRVVTRPQNWFYEKYIAALAKRGFVSPKGFVDQVCFVNEFLVFFGRETLRILETDIGVEVEPGWLKSIVRKHRKAFHPIRHILLMQFCLGSIERFLALEHKYKPFGDSPWPCLNTVAPHYLKPVVKTVRITTCCDTGRPVGTFECTCGFVYSRRGPDQNDQDRFHVGRVKAFGLLWEFKLKQVLEDRSLGLRDVGRAMGCDPKTVARYAKKLGIPVVWSTEVSGKKSLGPSQTVHILDVRRAQWLNLIDGFPGLAMSSLRRQNPGLYVWLYRHDREWLKLVSPLKVHRTNNRRVDWDSRDQSLLDQAREAVHSILNSGERPRRITVGTIGKMMNAQALLEKHLNKLPRTKSFLESSVESVEAFQCRRIKWAAGVLNCRGEQVRGWKLIRIAGIRPGFSQKIADELEQQIRIYSPKTMRQVGR